MTDLNKERGLVLGVSERDHIRGPSDAVVTLVEYGDYECPDCARSGPIISRVLQECGDWIRFVFRHFPRNSIHPHAGAAAQAAEAAAAQRKFWEMHDLLLEHQQDLEPGDLRHYALKVGLELYKFEADVSSERFAHRIGEDYQSGLESGVKRTPTFFINGIRYNGPDEFEAIKKVAQAARNV